jgi:hypothetical protein
MMKPDANSIWIHLHTLLYEGCSKPTATNAPVGHFSPFNGLWFFIQC